MLCINNTVDCLLVALAARRGQQTNSTPLNRSMPQGCSMEKLRSSMSRLTHDAVAVSFHERYDVHSFWSWMWSKTQWSGTSSASLWNGPTAQPNTLVDCRCHPRLNKEQLFTIVSMIPPQKDFSRIHQYRQVQGWWRGTVAERQSLASKLSRSHAWPSADHLCG